MTTTEILALPAGRAADELVARALGVVPREVRARGSDVQVSVWSDSASLMDGWWSAEELRFHGAPSCWSQHDGLVVELLTNCQYATLYKRDIDGSAATVYWVADVQFRDETAEATAPTAALAVSRAIILAAAKGATDGN